MNQQATESTPDSSTWEGDALNRRRYSEFLSQYISARVSKNGESLTIALDAAWGAGKTFFVDKWSKDIEANNGGAIVFDAWKNDFSNEVLISFMAELSIGMKPLRKRISTQEKIVEKLNEQAKSLMNGFRKAALPAAGVIAKGLLKKFTGVAVDQIVEAIESEDSINIENFDFEKAMEGADKDFEKGLETFFKKTLEAHEARATATQDFKDALEMLVSTLQNEGAINGPLYVFVDELDRCRPDYAIKLLEGIKHLFAVKGVVFVISTNMDQLSKSVQAVYGGDFDGYNYLKRFFDFEFTLPAPDFYSFAKMLINEDSLLSGRNLDFGLHTGAYSQEDIPLARSFELIATACDLPLRAQRQVWMIAAAAAAGIPVNFKISVLWLFFLSVLRHGYPEILEKLGEKNFSLNDFKELCKPIGRISIMNARSMQQRSNQSGYGAYEEVTTILLLEILHVYHHAVFQTIDDIFKKMNDNNNIKYPQSLVNRMTGERPNPYDSGTDYRPSIRQYQELVKMGGLIS